MVDMAHIAGLVAAEQHPDPVPFADFVTSTTHKTLRGPRGGFVLCKKDWGQKINSAVFPGMQGGPLMHVIAAKAVAFGEALQPSFRHAHRPGDRQRQGRRRAELARAGFRLVSGGTDNHLLLVDVTSQGVTGKIAEQALDAAGITVNKNMIPFDTRPPLDPSRHPHRHAGADDARHEGAGDARIAGWIAEVLTHVDDAAVRERVHGQVRELCAQFPAPAEDSR